MGCTAEKVASVLKRAARRGLVQAVGGSSAALEFQLTARGRQEVRSGRTARLALFRLRVAATPAYACGVVDYEEMQDEGEEDEGSDLVDEPLDPGHPMNPLDPLQANTAPSRRATARIHISKQP